MTPSYITDLIPPTIGEINQYPLRNQDNIRIPPTRTVASKKSCIHSGIDMWNNLDQNLRNLESFSAFKNSLIKKSNSNATNVPSVYLSGQRYLSVLHARIRNYCSDLNYDLFSNHLRDDPFCNCILHEYETAEHFILKCGFFKDQRLTLFQATRQFAPLDINILLFAKIDLTHDQNVIIFSAVQDFIRQSKRF